MSIGTVENGDSCSATITGAAPNQTLNLVLQKGDKPVKGVDYYTAQDKQDIVDDVESDVKEEVVAHFNTVSDLKSDTSLVEGMVVETVGYYSANDGGAAKYKITNTASATDYQETLNNGLYGTVVKSKSTRKLKQPIYGYLWLEGIPASDQKINIRNYKINGFDGFILCLHLNYENGEFTLREDLDTIKELCQYCEEQNMKVNSIKFHFVPNSTVDSTILTKYGTIVSFTMSELSDYCENVYVFNEATYLSGNETKVLEIITALKANYKVGISFNKSGLIATNSSILSALDFVGYNYYPNLSSQGKYSDKNLMQYKCDNNEDLNMIYYLISLFGKDKVNITETGIRDYYVYLREPSNYSQTQTEENNGEVVKLYYSIVLETLNNNVNSISTWFKTLYDSTFDFWTEWTGGMR